MRIWKYLILILNLQFFTLLCHAEGLSPSELHAKGTQSYTQKEYKQAQEHFSAILDKDPDNPIALTNLALTEFRLNNKFKAIGLLRKALTSDPHLPTAKAALQYVLAQSQVRDVPHQNEPYELIRKYFLTPMTSTSYLLFAAISLLSSGWIWLTFAGRRRRATAEEVAMPEVPLTGVLLGFLFVIFTGLGMLKIYDAKIARGTILDEKVSLQTAPGENQVVILDLYGGMEVVARQVQGDWVQVRYPGSLTGWIKKSSLLMTH